MTQVLVALATLTAVLRSAFLALGVGFAVLAAVDWSARTRRLNPFGGIARFLRGSVDPRLSGIERQVVRAAAARNGWRRVASRHLSAACERDQDDQATRANGPPRSQNNIYQSRRPQNLY